MNRRSGPSANRVERQLARSADAIERQCGQRPDLPMQGERSDGQPFWDVEDERLVYAPAGGEDRRWTTDSAGTLAFWVVRETTSRLAGGWAVRAHQPSDGARRERWAELIGAADPQWRERHLAWLAAAGRAGSDQWPTPTGVVNLVERLAARLAADAGQPHGPLPGVDPRADALPWIEVHGDELNYRVRAGGRDLRDDRTTDIGDLLFWVFEPVTREMARSGSGAGAGADWRGRWLELMVLVNPGWHDRVAAYL